MCVCVLESCYALRTQSWLPYFAELEGMWSVHMYVTEFHVCMWPGCDCYHSLCVSVIGEGCARACVCVS